MEITINGKEREIWAFDTFFAKDLFIVEREKKNEKLQDLVKRYGDKADAGETMTYQLALVEPSGKQALVISSGKTATIEELAEISENFGDDHKTVIDTKTGKNGVIVYDGIVLQNGLEPETVKKFSDIDERHGVSNISEKSKGLLFDVLNHQCVPQRTITFEQIAQVARCVSDISLIQRDEAKLQNDELRAEDVKLAKINKSYANIFGATTTKEEL